MTCTLATLAACFSMSGFYIDGSVIHANYGEARGVFSGEAEWHKDHWITTLAPSIDTSAQNPYMRIAVGYSVDWSARWQTRIDYSHESSIATGKDRGTEKFSLGVTWRPFAK